jgi:hypothetical protein
LIKRTGLACCCCTVAVAVAVSVAVGAPVTITVAVAVAPSVGCLVSTARGPAAIKRRKKKCEGKRDRKIRSNRKQHVGKKNKIR